MKHPAQPVDPDIALRRSGEGEVTLYIDGSQAMQGWEEPLMRRSAEILCRNGGSFLECGLGLGFSAIAIAEQPKTVKHTVIEVYPEVIEQFEQKHPDRPANLEIVRADFFEYIESVPTGTVDGLMLDPWLPRAMRDDAAWWDNLMRTQITRILRPGGFFMSFFVTEPKIEPRWEPYFDEVLIERRPYAGYSTSSYLEGRPEGIAYLQCFTNRG
ncbi:class I SAM-dependent methyltransferase [Paractinoplanes atraurantiacus]|uniref:Putative methyltransferase n=1 Tax=Paractinoplanes atraurantiacus TaxID=1036182 RepID=A0A285J015_9ACTN|nr:class I SAM-dependent methyltransferase [Actinoplanes atraurantiacus]SNY53572.1 Putative methyltransferase [Actinoplanes atraurantiacus]